MAKTLLAGFARRLCYPLQLVRLIAVLEQATAVCQDNKGLSDQDERKAKKQRSIFSFFALGKGQNKTLFFWAKWDIEITENVVYKNQEDTVFLLVSEETGQVKRSAIT